MQKVAIDIESSFQPGAAIGRMNATLAEGVVRVVQRPFHPGTIHTMSESAASQRVECDHRLRWQRQPAAAATRASQFDR